MNKNLIGIKEMALKLSVPPSWIYHRTRRNEIPHYKIGKYVRFDEDEVMKWVSEQNKIRRED